MKYFLIILFSFPFWAQGQDSSAAAVATTDEQIQEKVKKRIYPGGQDESDLRVQNQLVTPSRKLAPAQEEPSEPNSED